MPRDLKYACGDFQRDYIFQGGFLIAAFFLEIVYCREYRWCSVSNLSAVVSIFEVYMFPAFFKSTIVFHDVLQLESPLQKRMLSPVCNWYALYFQRCAIIPSTLLKPLGWLLKDLQVFCVSHMVVCCNSNVP